MVYLPVGRLVKLSILSFYRLLGFSADEVSQLETYSNVELVQLTTFLLVMIFVALSTIVLGIISLYLKLLA